MEPRPSSFLLPLLLLLPLASAQLRVLVVSEAEQQEALRSFTDGVADFQAGADVSVEVDNKIVSFEFQTKSFVRLFIFFRGKTVVIVQLLKLELFFFTKIIVEETVNFVEFKKALIIRTRSTATTTSSP